MTAVELVARLSVEVPEAEQRGALALVNAELQRLWGVKQWTFSWTLWRFTPVISAADGVVTDGDATVTAAGLALTSSYVGAEVRITLGDGSTVEGTVDSVTSATEFELASAWDADTESAVVVEVYQPRWTLPTDFRMAHGLWEGLEEGDVPFFDEEWWEERQNVPEWRDPRDWTLGPVLSGVRKAVLWRKPPAGTVLTLSYWRKPTALTNLVTALDVPVELEELVYLGLLGRLLMRLPEEGALQRKIGTEQLRKEALKAARSWDNEQRAARRRNRRVMG